MVELQRQVAVPSFVSSKLRRLTGQAEPVKLPDLVLPQLQLQSRNVTDAELKALSRVMAK